MTIKVAAHRLIKAKLDPIKASTCHLIAYLCFVLVLYIDNMLLPGRATNINDKLVSAFILFRFDFQ